jgi:UDP-glucuronate 4-epimerase
LSYRFQSFELHRLLQIYNIGNNAPIKVLDFIHILEDIIGKKAILKFVPMQPGDVERTWADVEKLKEYVGYSPTTKLEDGLEKFYMWYKAYQGDA